MQQKIFFFDFDETLYSHSTKCVPKSAQAALRRLQSSGHDVVIATGRGPESIRFIQHELGFPCETIIMLNGQLIFRNGLKIFERFITLPSLNLVMEWARANGFAYGGYCAFGEIVDHVNERVAGVWKDFNCPLPSELKQFEKRYPLYQGHLYITREEAEGLKQHLGDYLVNWSHQYLVNLISNEAGKSQGIRWLMQASGVEKEHSYAFGDGFNDKDMLLAVGHGIAMGNAANDLKQVAELVTDTVDEDGVVHALTYYKIL